MMEDQFGRRRFTNNFVYIKGEVGIEKRKTYEKMTVKLNKVKSQIIGPDNFVQSNAV